MAFSIRLHLGSKGARCWVKSVRRYSRLGRDLRLGLSRANGSRVENRGAQRRDISSADLSYSEGPREPPLLQHTIPEHFASIVSRYGDRPAVMSRAPAMTDATPNTTTLTYESLDRLSNTLARSLRSLGVKKGDRVAVSLGNVAENVVLTYAIFKLGAILVPLNPSFNAHQVSAALSHLGVEILVVGAVTDLAYKPCRGRSNLELLTSLVPNLAGSKVESPTVTTLKSIVLLDNTPSHPLAGPFPLAADMRALTPYATLLTSSSPRPLLPDTPLQPGETINIQFTSGTTSAPKAAMLSHTGILNNGNLIGARMGLEPSDRIVCPPPLFHCFGSVLGLQTTATHGACLVLPSPAFDPAATLYSIAETRATGLYGVATMFVAALDLLASPNLTTQQLPKDAFSNLRKGIAAGSSVPEALMRRLFERLGLRDLVICYGMTETSPVSAMTTPGDPFEKRTCSVGQAMPHTKLKVVEAGDRGTVVPRGVRGELAVAGYLVMDGYWGDAERTAVDRVVEEDVDCDGDGDGRVTWMYTGDEAAMDDDGYVEITGRIKDLIIRSGENIHPLEVENCLFQHPLVREVSVVGVPDGRYGEVVGAFVVPHRGVRIVDVAGLGGEGIGGTISSGGVEAGVLSMAGEGVGDDKVLSLSKDDVRDWVRTKLSSHLAPTHVFWIDEYPKTASGKIQKYKLRDLARELTSRC